MSASTTRTAMRPGEELVTRLAARRELMLAERAADRELRIAERRADRVRAGFALDEPLIELEARCDAVAELVPIGSARATMGALAEAASSADLGPALEAVAGLEREADRRFLRAARSELVLEELAARTGADLRAEEAEHLADGTLRGQLRFGDVVIPVTVDGAGEGIEEIVWHGAESNVDGCAEQQRFVRELAAASGLAVEEEDGDRGGEARSRTAEERGL